MRIAVRVLTVALVLTSLALAQAPATQKSPPPKPTLDRVLNASLRGVESEFVDAADAMPESTYSFAPTQGEFKGVRTFALQVRHVATVNYLIGGVILGEKPPVDIGNSENGPDAVSSKADIMKYLKGSFDYMHKAVTTLTSEEQALVMVKNPFGPGQMPKLSLAILIDGHCFDHYGQMVEYLRMNGIIPPASRPRPPQK